MLKEGHKKFGVVLTQELEVLAILMGGRKRFPPFKRGGGGTKSFTLSQGGVGRKKFWSRDFPIL